MPERVQVAKVLPFVPVSGVFSYLISDDLDINLWDVVQVEFGAQLVFGAVCEIVPFEDEADEIEESGRALPSIPRIAKQNGTLEPLLPLAIDLEANTDTATATSTRARALKEVNCTIWRGAINEGTYKLAEFAASYNIDYVGNFLRMVFPFMHPPKIKKPKFEEYRVFATADGEQGEAFARARSPFKHKIAEELRANDGITVGELACRVGASANVVRNFAKNGLIKVEEDGARPGEDTSPGAASPFCNGIRLRSDDKHRQLAAAAELPALSAEQLAVLHELEKHTHGANRGPEAGPAVGSAVGPEAGSAVGPEAGSAVGPEVGPEAGVMPGFCCSVVQGETGSGKTEVYFHLIQKVLRNSNKSGSGAQVLLMLPEISLANTIQKRFVERFGFRPIVWHSGVGGGQRYENYANIQSGTDCVVIGTRSGLFLPYANLQLIIVDEEHDPSYKQNETPQYNARDMAIVRAKFLDIPIVLLSATPSIETFINTQIGKYKHYTLKSRFFDVPMPDVHLVDLKCHPPPSRGWFLSSKTREKLLATLEGGLQVMVFINRRGYAPVMICALCGKGIRCKYCDTSLTQHRMDRRMKCHQCGYSAKIPVDCPFCKQSGLREVGAGVERILEELGTFVPKKFQIGLFTSDTMSTELKAGELLQKVQNHEINVIVGTQIVSKGYHFPKLNFICIVDADCAFHAEDYRSTEKMFQLTSQVVGRSGREGKAGSVYIQTYNPNHTILELISKNDAEGFYLAEAKNRERFFLPPFSRYISIIVSGKDREASLEYARKLALSLDSALRANERASGPNEPTESAEVLGPVPAIISYIRLRYRFRILVIAKRGLFIQSKVLEASSSVKKPSGCRMSIDVDPMHFF